jgi:hypothetical protein
MNRHHLAGIIAVAGAGCVIAAAMLPWLTVFHGLQSYSGIDGTNGRPLFAGGVAGTVLAIWFLLRPLRTLRYAIGMLGFALAVFISYLWAQLLVVYHELEHMYLPAIGPGLVVAAAGALLMISTLFIPIEAQGQVRAPAGIDARSAALVALASGAGTIHLAVVAEHYLEYPLYGVFFVLLGVAQLGWAAAVAIRGVSPPLLFAALANWPVAVLWVLSRTSGLPVGPQPWVPESVGLAGIACTAFEVALVAWALWSLKQPRRVSRWLEPVGWALPVSVAATTVSAVLLGVGGHT